MKFDLEFERTFPHPIHRVWRALTEPDALARWLMETDFAPEPGRAFRMWCENDQGATDTYLCSVEDIDPPHRMVWSWILEGSREQRQTRVEFRLREAEAGTVLSIRHSGDRDPKIIERFRGGWPVKLDQLDEALQRA